jgi:hypothetical protein
MDFGNWTYGKSRSDAEEYEEKREGKTSKT